MWFIRHLPSERRAVAIEIKSISILSANILTDTKQNNEDKISKVSVAENQDGV